VSDALGVALVGVGRDQWSGVAHIPAITATGGVRLERLVASNPDSARAAGELWHVPAGDDLHAMLDDDQVDVVTITVRVAKHAEIARAAIAAGKHVYCEWPLATNAVEARGLAELSRDHPGRLHLVGLQGRLSPRVGATRDLVASGRLGRPLTASIRVLLPQGLQPRPRHRAHLRHRASAANVLTIQGGHAIDVLASILGGEPGPLLAAKMWTAVDEFTVLETGERLARDAPDNVIAIVEIGSVPVSVQLSQTAASTIAEMKVLGTEGVLTIRTADQPQMSQPEISFVPLSGEPELVGLDDRLSGIALDPTHPGYQVAIAYRALAQTIVGRPTEGLPTFTDVLPLHDLLDSFQEASAIHVLQA